MTELLAKFREEYLPGELLVHRACMHYDAYMMLNSVQYREIANRRNQPRCKYLEVLSRVETQGKV